MSESSSSDRKGAIPMPELPATRKRGGKGRIVLSVLFLLLLGAGFCLYQWYSGRVTSQWAAVGGAEYSLRSASAGRVIQVAVKDGQIVDSGELLVALDSAPLERALTEAEAALELAMQGGVPSGASDPVLKEAEEGARQASDAARREEENARAEVERWTAEYARLQLQLRNPQISNEERAAATAAEADAGKNLEAARTRLNDLSDKRAETDRTLRRLHDAAQGTRPGPVQVELWRARVDEARNALDNAVILAPTRGKVFWVKAVQGGNVERGDELMKIMPLEGLWVEARFAAGVALREGQRCTVKLDGGPELDGRVQAVSRENNTLLAKIGITLPDTQGLSEEENGAESSLYPGQNAEVVVRVK